ncbi:MAG: tetratricopeptide repeat protein [Candidatus Hydrogenedentales bacterium]|jgi:tetratricopeptide (TPR) repeat protein
MSKVHRFIRKLRRYCSDLDYRGQVRERLKISWLTLRIALRPNNLDLYDKRASQFSRLEMHAHAGRDYTRILELFPRHGKSFDWPLAYLYACRAETFSERTRWEEAIWDYSSAIACAGINDNVKELVSNVEFADFLACGFMYSEDWLFEKRGDCYAAIWQSTRDEEMRTRAVDDYNRAIEIRIEAVMKEPGFGDEPYWLVYMQCGRCREAIYKLTGDLDVITKALEDYDKALELEPTDLVLCSKASALENSGDDTKAIAALTAAIDFGGKSTNLAYGLRSELHAKLGHFLEAIADSDKGLQSSLRELEGVIAAPEPPFVDMEVFSEPRRSGIAFSLANHHRRRAELWEKHGDPLRAAEDRQRARDYRGMITVRPVHSHRNFVACDRLRPSATTANT